MGLLAGYFALRYAGGGQNLRLFLTTGILGGFTTFSAFSLDAVLLWERGDIVGGARLRSRSRSSSRSPRLSPASSIMRAVA